jgi:hypothetical protein
MKCYCLLFIILLSSQIFAQNITGTVRAADSQKPVPLASVFFSNTSYGTVTNELGQFSFTHLPIGKYDLIVSYLGYETQVHTIETDKQIGALNLILQPKAKELANVVIEPYEKDNWARWGTFFLENFIGLSEFASDCKIKNTKAITFRNYRKSNRLAAFSDEQLIIENKALGYRIKYQLEKFEYNFKTHVFFFQGFPLFEQMATNSARKRKQWESRRMETYQGSLMHFLRSLFINQLIENQFQVRHLRKEPNLEKERIKLLTRLGKVKHTYVDKTLTIGSNQVVVDVATDSTEYYNRILQQPDVLDIINPTVLTGDSIAFAIDSTTAGLYFDNFLHITYLGKKEPFEYARSQGRSQQIDRTMSLMELLNKRGLEIFSNGSFYNPTDLLLHNYWAFWEKMSTMLPYNYKPPRSIP